MSRSLRIEFAGTVSHVTSRGDRREPIYRDDEDRTTHLEVIAQAMDRFDAQVLAYCQTGGNEVMGSGLASCLPPRHDPRMSRPLRIEFSGAVYHVTSRGDRRESIYRDGEDRTTHLEVIAQLWGQVLHLASHPATIPACPAPCASSFPVPSTSHLAWRPP